MNLFNENGLLTILFNENGLLAMKFKVDEIISEKKALNEQLKSLTADKKETEDNFMSAKKAQLILKTEARKTQSEIEEHISNTVTMALAAVEVDDPNVPKPPEFIARIVERRDSTECDLLFKEGDREQHPFNSSGFGYCDVADYALRVCYILLSDEYGEDEIRKTLILDEPFRNADPKLQSMISEMLKMVSHDLGFQQIIVSHAEGVNIKADKKFHVKKYGVVSTVLAVDE